MKFSFFDAAKKAYRAARSVLQPLFKLSGQATPTRRELNLQADEWAVKQKLGPSFFTRKLGHNTKVARLMSLTPQEFELAQRRGWVPRDAQASLYSRMRRRLRERIARNNEPKAEA